MLTPLENRGILLMPDFEQRNWLWQYDGSQPPIPFWDGQLIGYGLPLSLQKDLYTWFATGYKDYRGGALDPIQFHERGRELAKRLAGKAQGRLPVFFGFMPEGREKGSPAIERILSITSEERMDVPFRRGSMRELEITVCFGRPRSGWMFMAILSTAFNMHHVIHLSDVFDPFEDMVSWVGNIVKGESSVLGIDEEGYFSYLTARIIDNEWFELIVETDYYEDEENEGIHADFTETKILAVVSRRDFVKEFYRRFQDFLLQDYTWFGWNSVDPEDYTPEQRAAGDLRNIDLSLIREYLSAANKTGSDTSNLVKQIVNK